MKMEHLIKQTTISAQINPPKNKIKKSTSFERTERRRPSHKKPT